MTKGRPKGAKVWTDEKLNRVKDLTQHNSASEIGKIFGKAKIAILLTAPPEKTLTMPIRPFWLDAITSCKANGSIPESGT